MRKGRDILLSGSPWWWSEMSVLELPQETPDSPVHCAGYNGRSFWADRHKEESEDKQTDLGVLTLPLSPRHHLHLQLLITFKPKINCPRQRLFGWIYYTKIRIFSFCFPQHLTFNDWRAINDTLPTLNIPILSIRSSGGYSVGEKSTIDWLWQN